jgi:acetyl-CoA C-acetyltransferase
MPVAIFALVESALAAAAGRSAEEQRIWLGELMAPFTEVAASRPEVAWFPTARAPGEISGLRPDNRFVSEPYTKLMCSFPTIDLAAAVLVTSEGLADRLGIAAERRVRPWGITCASEPGAPSTWAEMHRSVALRTAVDRTLDRTSVSPDELVGFDLYSCFPAAVQIALGAFGVDPSDPRPFTQTGGLPYFGGPGASYSLHGVVCTVERVRTGDGAIGAVVGVGGGCNDFSVGLYSVDEPRRDPVFEDAKDITETLARTSCPVAVEPEGVAVVEAMTVFHERDAGATSAPVIARMPDGSRAGARAADPELPAALSGTSLVGREVHLDQRDGQTVYTPT